MRRCNVVLWATAVVALTAPATAQTASTHDVVAFAQDVMVPVRDGIRA